MGLQQFEEATQIIERSLNPGAVEVTVTVDSLLPRSVKLRQRFEQRSSLRREAGLADSAPVRHKITMRKGRQPPNQRRSNGFGGTVDARVFIYIQT